MKRQLSLGVLLALLLGCGAMSVKAQTPFIIETFPTGGPPPTGGYTNPAPGQPNWILSPRFFVGPADTPGFNTFSVVNNNSYPVALLDVGYLHIDTTTLTLSTGGTLKVWSNGNSYSVWVKRNPTPGAPTPIHPSNGWTLVSTFGPVVTPGGGVISVTPGINVIIPPGKKYQFAVVTTGKPQMVGYMDTVGRPLGAFDVPRPGPLPNSFVEQGVEWITTVAAGEYWGAYPNTPLTNLTPASAGSAWVGYHGFVTLVKSAPEPPTVAVSGMPVCDSTDLTMTATAPSYVTSPIFTWKDPNGTVIGTGPSITITAARVPQSGKYEVTVTDGGLVSAPAIIDVVVLKTPAPTVTGKMAYCINEQFEPVSTNGQNVKWYTNPAAGGIGTIIPPYINTSVPGGYTFYASQTQSGCESDKTPVLLTVAPKPSAPGVVSPIGICEGVTPDSLKANGQNLKWYYTPSGGVASLVSPMFSTGKLDTFSFWVSQTVDGCEGPRARLDAIVTFKPNGQINASADSICQNQEATFSYYGSGLPESAYNWGLPTGSSLLEGTQAGPLRVKFDSSGIQTVTLQVGNLGCYSDVYVRKIRINKIPDAGIWVKDDVCKNAAELVSLYEYTPTIDTFAWDFDGGVVSHYATDQGPYSVTWATPGKKVVKLLVTDRLCRAIKTDTFMVHELPDAKITIEGYKEGDKVCQGDSIRMAVRTIEPASQYVWSPTRFFESFNNLPVTYSRVDFNSMVKLHVTDEYGCKNADSVKIETQPCCNMLFPSAFSPNGDGKNDIFHLLRSGSNDVNGNVKINDIKTLRIVNRWGQVVFETANPRMGWDGTFNGEPADMGIYFYYVNYRCNQILKEQRGEVTLVR